ncbi:SDR family NAD(P)-dependent oxidoreductase [Altererythrobacter aurantiacus]|uniref:SDR family NAD(P)-dependent oxidoreductase n=1 Tax=Parapontixanthobacter aurantiacus TaxID=1463599 RepID=A0A844ZEI4_9SPHN|nr:SDR family NAD(P)-dependent oxidoreductase [Parapontixanthobacter aurantiacus]MXO85417.1 SDR family NAD(P)-dependent oxidoreductase [Parapontixanthobacter aurantiacus]
MGDVGQDRRSAAIFGASGGIGRALAEEALRRGFETVHVGSRSGEGPSGEGLRPFRFDYENEESIADFADSVSETPLSLIVVATGVLTLADGIGPERSFRKIDPDLMEKVFRVNTIGPALVAKHLLPQLPRDRRSVFAALSARVGSIGDNRLGGWHSYRASKAALNMLIRNFAIELARTHKQALAVALHPGTVDTKLSEPFQGNVPDKQLFTPQRSAAHLFDVIEGLEPKDSGGHFDWRGDRIPD